MKAMCWKFSITTDRKWRRNSTVFYEAVFKLLCLLPEGLLDGYMILFIKYRIMVEVPRQR